MTASHFPLEQLLAPVVWDTFLERTWEKDHLILKARGSDYYDQLFRREDVDALVPLAVGERGVRLAKDGNKSEVPNDAAALYQAYQQGSTVVINRLHRIWRPVNLFCLALEERLNHPTGVNLYLTPPNATGFGAHYDTHDVFILQVAGRKTWDLYGVHCELPLEGQKTALPADLGAPDLTVDLEPGSLLYMPRGMVHQARTSEGSSSLHLTLGVHVLRWGDLMSEALNLARLNNLEFRRALPPGFLNRRPAELAGHLSALLAQLAKAADGSGAVCSLADVLFARTPSPIDHHFTVLDKLDDIGQATLMRKRTGMLYYFYEEGENFVVRFSGGTVGVPQRIAPAMEYVLKSDWFSVASIPQLDESGRLVLARRLVREGLLTTDVVSD